MNVALSSPRALLQPKRWILPSLLALAGAACWTPSAQAVPYACNLTNGGTTISFRLNESADNVKIVSGGGATTNDLGARAAGVHVETLVIVGDFQVVVFKASGPGYRTPIAPGRAAVLQTSTDNNTVRFNNPRGLAVNNNPASPYFGRVYVSNSSATNSPRAVGDGIYLLNSDLTDALGQGDVALTGGLNFGESVTHSPYHISIGEDDNLYISDWGTNNGTLYVTDPDVSAGQNVLGGPTGSPFPVTSSRVHGSISAGIVTGSLGMGNLTAFVVDEDYQTNPDATAATERLSLWRHDIGASLPGPFTAPTRIALHPNTFLRTVGNQVMDLARNTNGHFYVANYRSVGNEANVWAVDASGVLVWSSLVESRAVLGNPAATDILKAAGGIDLSPSGDTLAVMHLETNGIWILPMLPTGLPDITNRLVLAGFNTVAVQGREVAFDRAGNLYAVSQSAGLLRVFSPGGTTTAVTGSDGTFNIIRPPGVSVVTTTNLAYETIPGGQPGMDPPLPGAFSLVRQGDISGPVTVVYTLTGTAINGTDYTTNVLSAVIPAGQTNVEVFITPISDGLAEFTETVTLTVVGSGDYDLATPVTASLSIVDDNVPNAIDISASDTNAFERFAGTDTLRFVLTRRGDTNLDLIVFISTSAGTAVPNVDFQNLPDAINFPAGAVTVTNDITIVDDGDPEGMETVGVRVIMGNDPYVPGSPDTAYGAIIDNDPLAACVLFSDDFDANTAANWTERFGAGNGTLDRTATWSFDYGVLGIPSAPQSPGTTRGLFVTVNKDATPSSAGINFYPNGQSFSGNHALRFDLFLDIGNSNQTEHALAGLNHSGTQTNWVTQTAGDVNATRGNDGVFVAITSSPNNSRDYAAHTATNAASQPGVVATNAAAAFSSVFTVPPYTFAGAIGCASNSLTRTWAEVELRQLDGKVTLSVNHFPVLEYTNTSGFNSGNVMIGYNDQFSSVGSALNFAIFDNVRVVQLDLQIKSITLLSGNQVEIDFVSPVTGYSASSFRLQSAAVLGSPTNFADDNSAVITAIPGGWRATTTQSGDMRYYRIRRLP